MIQLSWKKDTTKNISKQSKISGYRPSTVILYSEVAYERDDLVQVDYRPGERCPLDDPTLYTY